MITHLVKIFSKKNYFNELARFGQFIKYTLFRSPFSPLLVPFSATEGPLLVPISLKIRSPFSPHFDKFRSPFYVGAVLVFILPCLIYSFVGKNLRNSSQSFSGRKQALLKRS